jgi:predicted phage tail protein
MKFNPNLKIVFTVSPIRHTKDGVTTNSLSKSTLLYAIHQMISRQKEFLPTTEAVDGQVLSYFPSYEYMMDDLR